MKDKLFGVLIAMASVTFIMLVIVVPVVILSNLSVLLRMREAERRNLVQQELHDFAMLAAALKAAKEADEAKFPPPPKAVDDCPFDLKMDHLGPAVEWSAINPKGLVFIGKRTELSLNPTSFVERMAIVVDPRISIDIRREARKMGLRIGRVIDQQGNMESEEPPR